MINFRSATEADAIYVGENLRPVDRREVERGGTGVPRLAPLHSLQKSIIAWTMLRDGTPIAIFGVAPYPTQGVGVVWLLGTPAVGRAARALVHSGRYYVGLMSKLFPRLMNAVDSENEATRRWLAALGFVEGQTIPLGPLKHPFVYVEYNANV